MAAAMVSSHYAPQQNVHYGYIPPPSPPMDETSKCSLPSISNLLGLADQGSPTSETFRQEQLRQQEQQQQSQKDTRPGSSHYGNPAMLKALPPSPPMSSDASFEGYNSPSTRSVSQLSSGSNNGNNNTSSSSNYYFETTPPLGQMDASSQQIAAAATASAAAPRVSVQPSAYQPHFAGPSYISQPAMPAFYPPIQASAPPPPPMSGLYFQRPLPQTFPPPLSVTLAPVGANPWQHHHYIAPAAAAAYPQSQDRYICPTCNKAFSRPSSLRIHSHSHTGEKPFKCPVAGCGKAFSVRSNMKRHERGCHNYDSNSSNSNASRS